MYEAVIFDSDGVLVEITDDERAKTGIRAAFRNVGVEDPDPEHVERLVVGVTPERLRRVCAPYDLDPEDFWPHRDGELARVQSAAVRAGEKGFYDDAAVLYDLPVPLGIVSSNQHETVRTVVEHHDLPVDTYYGREPEVASLSRKKPNPHYLERALSDLGVAPEDALFVGDSETDVLAAHRAGTDSMFLRRPHRQDYALDADPTYEFDSLTPLQDLLDGVAADGGTGRGNN